MGTFDFLHPGIHVMTLLCASLRPEPQTCRRWCGSTFGVTNPQPLALQFQNISNAAIPSASVNASIVYNDTSVSYCGQYGKGFNDDWPSAAWIACMFLFNSGSACAALAVITSILSLFWNTDKASASFSVCATLFFFISVFVFPAGFGGSLPAQTVSAMDDVCRAFKKSWVSSISFSGGRKMAELVFDTQPWPSIMLQ
jgi:hypothetical protein